MKIVLILLAATTLSSPALAQHGGHGHAASGRSPAATCTPEHEAMGHCSMPAPAQQSPMPAASCTPEHAAMGHCTMAPPATRRSHDTVCTAEHAAMGHCRMPAAPPGVQAAPHDGHGAHPHAGHGADPHVVHTADPHAGHAADPHAGHGADPHAGHALEMRNPPRPPVAPPPPGAFSGPAHAADLIFGTEHMAPVRAHIVHEHGAMPTHRFILDELEVKLGRGHVGFGWDAQFWYGGDIDKLWLKTKGEGEFDGALEHAEIQALWSRAIDPWFDVQAGVRQDFGQGARRTHAVLGLHGLAPWWFEVEGMLFLSTNGELTARLEAEYDLRITQRLVLQPSLELDFSLQNIPEIGIGAGLSSAELGARLRYEIEPNLAPYVGIKYERGFGNTARFARSAGREAGGWNLLVGVRTWF
ncbi:MAG: copper resistance protein B [Allosphingosinicella sp.]|uniref:copper resistance protein B n=1 Tax=Allosphingosinicella sp. TaxID=2823234 RepID=UPI00393AA8C0